MLPYCVRRLLGGASVSCIFFLGILSPARAAVYVNAAAPGPTHDGTTWAKAFVTVQEGINAAAPTSAEIWVAAGRYTENLTIAAPVKLYGGFAGTETALSARNYRTSVTILDGKSTERVINMTGSAGAAVVDGFTLTNGRTGEHGGAIRTQDCSPMIRNNIVTGNYAAGVGGAMYLLRGTPVVTANIVTANTSNDNTCGIYVDTPTNARVANNVVARNRANNGNRGGIFVAHAPADIIGNTVTDNYGNGGITTYNSASRIANNIVAWNTGGIRLETGAAPTLQNNCVWQNRGYDYTNFAADPTGTDGNINADPMLSWDSFGIAHLRLGSPCINAGLDSVLLPGETDVDGQPRTYGLFPDIGADESVGSGPPQTVVFVKPTGDDTRSGATWALAKKTITAGMNAAYATGAEVWVAGGTYKESLDLINGIALYGGFNGTESQRSQRNWRTNVTTIDAESKTNVVRAGGWVTLSTVLDGFVLTNGSTTEHGAGIRCQDASPVIRNNIIRNNAASNVAGGVFILRGSPWIIGNAITANTGNECAGMYVESAPGTRIISNVVSRNRSNNGNRGGIFVIWHPVDIIGNTVTDNYGNGGITTYNSASRIANNIVAWNTGGIRLETGAAPTLQNNCVWQNRGYDYTNFAADPTGTDGNITADPMLSWDSFGAAHLRPGSPCLNAGLDSAFLSGETDVDGQPRKNGIAVDIGADESDGSVPSQSVLFVKPTGDDTRSGATWALAKKTITAGMNAAYATGAEVWVAGGTYKESLDLINGVALYGGFNGTESQRSQRNWRTNVTTIDAESKTNVVRAGGLVTLSTVLDGFVLTNGATTEHGAGIRCQDASPVIRNNIIRNNVANQVGGTAYVLRGAPWFVGNVITSNTANECGGIYVDSASGMRVASNVFSRNRSNNFNRSALFVAHAPVDILGNTFVGNYGNGSVTTYNSASRIIGNIIAFNTHGLRLETGAVPDVRKNVIYGNPVYDTTNFPAAVLGVNGNVSLDPKISPDLLGSYHLQPGSPCIDTGENSVFTAWDTDVDGQARKNGSTVDIGADEWDGNTPAAMVFYVKPTGSDTNTGRSWASAKKTIQAGIDVASPSGAEVWVAAGTYLQNIRLAPSVAVFGGFAGTETLRTQRNWRTNVTTIDGNKNGPVVYADGNVTRSAILDGFTITNGYASDHGGGIRTDSYASPIIRNNRIINNTAVSWGGGVFLAQHGGAWLINNIVSNNVSSDRGGGIAVNNAYYARVEGNVVTRNRGASGGIDCESASAYVVNNTITDNTGDGALMLWSAGGRAWNNIVAFNSSGVRTNNRAQDLLFRNNLVYGNATYNYSGMADPAGSNGNLSAMPLLSTDARGVPHLRASSPGINAGLNSAAATGVTDIDAQARIQNGTVDIGADEYDGSVPIQTVIYVRPGGSDAADGSSWPLAKRTLKEAIAAASGTGAEIWVAVGPYRENITLAAGVAMYGGFKGNETLRSQRDFRKNVTVIDGGGSGRTVYAPFGTLSSTVLDGFTITNGRSDWGGGIRTEDSGALFRNCTITKNTATGGAGGAYSLRGSAAFLNCVFSDNTAPDTGGLYFESTGSGRVESSLFVRNTATNVNGALVVVSGDAAVINCTLVNNTGEAALVVWNCLGKTINNIIAFNTHGFRTNAVDPVLRDNCVGMNTNWDWWPGNWSFDGLDGNMTTDPLFVNRAAADFHLMPASPCLDMADTAVLTPGLPDLDGFARVDHGSPDLGCYELGVSVTPTKLVFLAAPDSGIAGTPFPVQPVVAAVDANGRVAGTYTGNVSVSIKVGTGTSGAVLNGTKTLNFVAGLAYFDGLSIDRSGRGYVLRASGLTAVDSAPFDVSPSAPRLVFTTQPSGALRDAAFRQQPVVAVRDDSGNLTSYTGPVVLSIKSGTGTAGAILNGTRTVNAVAGVAAFTDLSINTLGEGYILTASTGSLPPQDSLPFNVTPPGELLVFTVQPGGAVVSRPLIMQPVLRVMSRDGILATDYNGTVTIAIKSGTGPAGAVLSGTKTVNVVNGVATFSNLALDKVGLRYVLTASSGAMTADSDVMRVVATASDLLTRTWTLDADFDEGRYSLTGHTPTSNQVNLISYQVKPYIWVPNLSGSISKIDVVTGNEIARYRTGPYYTYPNPSRTTVDLRGNCYVANRRIGTLVKVGSEETGDWIDRNGNGVCDTSRDLNGDGDIQGAEELPWNQDECVLFEVSLIPGREGTYHPGQFTQYTNDDSNPGIRSLAIDASNNLWAAGYNTASVAARKFYYINGITGQIENVVDVSSTQHTAYGAVTDNNGVVWSSGQGYNHVLRFDPTTSPVSFRRIDLPHNPYGIGVDNLNHVFVSGWTSNKISRLNALTGEIEKTIDAPTQLRGVVCSADNDVWTVSTSDGKLYRYDNNLTTQKAAIPVGDQPTGCAVDAFGKIWACNLGGTDATIVRINPATNAVELTKPIKGSTGHYSYSDMTGGVSTSVTARRGTWTVDFDGGDLNRPWGTISWTRSVQAGTSLSVRARSSNDKKNWTVWEAAGNGADLTTTVPGRYLQVEVTFTTQAVGTTPILLDLTAQALARPTYTAADAATALKIAAGLMPSSAMDFSRLNVTSSGLPERVTVEDAMRILKIVRFGE